MQLIQGTQSFQVDKTSKVKPGYAIIPGRQNPKINPSRECNYCRDAFFHHDGASHPYIRVALALQCVDEWFSLQIIFFWRKAFWRKAVLAKSRLAKSRLAKTRFLAKSRLAKSRWVFGEPAILAKSRFGEKPFWRKAVLAKRLFGEKPSWRKAFLAKSILAKSIFGEKNVN